MVLPLVEDCPKENGAELGGLDILKAPGECSAHSAVSFVIAGSKSMRNVSRTCTR